MTRPCSSRRPPVSVRKIILNGCVRERELARGDVERRGSRICPPRVSPRQARIGRWPARRAGVDRLEVDAAARVPTRPSAIGVDRARRLEDAGGDGAGAGAQLLERLDEAQVLARSDTRRAISRTRGEVTRDAVVALPTGRPPRRAPRSSCGPGAVDDDRVEADVLEERERRGEPVEVPREDAAADLDDRRTSATRRAEYCLRYCSTSLRPPRLPEEPDDDVLRGVAALLVTACLLAARAGAGGGEEAPVGGRGLGEVGRARPTRRRCGPARC